MRIYPLEQLVKIARERSPFYRELYASLSPGEHRLNDLPLIDQDAFWQANTSANNRLLTGPMTDGIVFKSGGTTGSPKFAIYTLEEWTSFTEAFGRGLAANGLQRGERIANIFYGGELYASFLFIAGSLERCPVKTLQFPIMGAAGLETTAKLLKEYQIEVIAGLPTSILDLASYVKTNQVVGIQLKKALFGGESMYSDQRAYLEEVFPGIRILSIGYASVDAGLLGYADETCGHDEHRVFGQETILEIMDEVTDSPITENDRPGKVVITNLTRALMPIIRYPAGDLACWVETAGNIDRKFRVLGRSEEGARVGPMTLYIADIQKALAPFVGRLDISNFQLRVVHRDRMDQCFLRIASSISKADTGKVLRDIVENIYCERPMYKELIEGNKLHPLEIEWIHPDQLLRNQRSGKIRRIIDERL